MEFMKFTGKTEEDALTEAKIALGATTDEIEYEVLEKGTSGFLGIGSKPAVIQARKKCSVEDYAREFLNSDRKTRTDTGFFTAAYKSCSK